MKKHILTIDDEIDITDLLQYFLQKEGYIVTVANSGNDAISCLKKTNFDIIISDFHMQNGNGMKVLEYTKTLDKVPYFLFLSAAHENIEKDCLRLGANKFLRKPISMIDLNKELQMAIGLPVLSIS